MNAPVPLMVGLSQRAAANPPPQAEPIKMFGPGTQAKFEITQALPPSQLTKSHANKLIPAGESSEESIPAIADDDTAKGVVGNEGEEMAKTV
jgi:hypothetical protein